MSPSPAAGALPSGLGPHCVGRRVVVRRVVRGETGPSGGPAMTDLLGVMETWTTTETTVRAADDSVVTIALADIVSGKPVPPRPSTRMRATPRAAQVHANAMWADLDTEPLGDWLLRSSGPTDGRVVARANSVLAMGDPGAPMAAAVDRVLDFYAQHGQPAWAQVVVGGDVEAELTARGWGPARPGEADTAFQVGSVARVLRALAGRGSTVPVTVSVDGPRMLGVVEETAGPLASGRAALDDDWVGLHDLWTAPDHRRQGLSSAVIDALLDEAASTGALTAYLQVREDNAGALALYDSLGFSTHHVYRYLAAPG